MLYTFNDDVYDELDDVDNCCADDDHGAAHNDNDRRADDDGGAGHYFDDFLHLILDNRTVDYIDNLAVRWLSSAGEYAWRFGRSGWLFPWRL